MKRTRHKIQLTVRLAPDTLKRAKEIERATGTPVSVVIAEAARESLTVEPFETPSTRNDHFKQTVLNRINASERTVMTTLLFVRETLGVLLRVYLNHTPAVPESERAAASLSGQVRFRKAEHWIHRNTQMGVSIFDPTSTASEADDVA